MPVDVDSSATFGDLCLRLAVRAGCAEQTGAVAALPTDADVLARIKRCVNDGYDRFLRAYKAWSFMDHTLLLTLNAAGTGPLNVEGDAGRYRAPRYVSGPPKADWTYQDARSTVIAVRNVHPSMIEARRQSLTGRIGIPCWAACRSLETGDRSSGQRRGWEFLFWPIPDANYILSAPFRIKRHEMVELTERHIAGSDHDAAIHAFARLVWFEDDAENPTDLERCKREVYGDPGTGNLGVLAESVALDVQNQPDTVGENSGRGFTGTPDLPHIFAHNGVPIAYGD